MQVCESVSGYQEIWIESNSHPGTEYCVVLSDEGAACDCIGYIFNQKCSHIRKAMTMRCKWDEGQEPKQSPMQQRRHQCPRCRGKTKETDGEAR